MACSLEAFFLGLISTQLLWKGVILDNNLYSLNAPRQVSIEEGLCAMIPCNFTYDKKAWNSATLKGFWKKGIDENKDTTVVANSSQKSAQNRFQIIGDLTARDCSLLILNAQKNDTGDYFFRMEKGPLLYSYVSYKPKLNVTERRSPKIQILDTMTEGNSTNITCATSATCSRMPPKFTWNGFSKYVDSHSQMNGTQVYSSVVNFLPSAADHKRNITCRVNYTNEINPVPRETTVQLNVIFKPQMLGFNVERFHSNKSQKNFTNISQLSVPKGDHIQLYCNVNSNPSPEVTWFKGTQDLQMPPQALNVLQLSDLKLEDAGTYTCHAANRMGVDKTSFELFVTDPKKTLLLIVTVTLIMFAVIVLITGIIFAFKRSRRKRKRVIDSEAGNTLTDAKKPNTSDLAAQEVNGVPPKPRSTHESVSGDPEEIHYATLSFKVPNPQPDIIAEDGQTDYAEIKLCNSQGKEA